MKGICFIEPLHNKTVKKIKVQTRRIIPEQFKWSDFRLLAVSSGEITAICPYEDGITYENERKYPRYKIGDILYLKEPYIDDSDMFFTAFPIHEILTYNGGTILYQYGNDTSILDSVYGDRVKWKNKLFMPAYAARHYIEIIAVRGERLQDISNQDCIKEGIYKHISHARVYWMNGFDGLMYETPRYAYEALINKINGKGTWDSNPWVWVYDYELIDRKEAAE